MGADLWDLGLLNRDRNEKRVFDPFNSLWLQ